MTSIFIVEDHKLLLASLVRLLHDRGGFDISAVAETAQEALEQLSDLSVDLVLVDVSLPLTNGIDLVAALKEKYPRLPCLMLSGHASRQYVERSISAGASGYILKDDVPGIIEGIRTVLHGGTYFSSQLHHPG